MKGLIPYFLVLTIFLAGCSSGKKLSSNKGDKDVSIGSLSNETRMNAERIFFDAQKEKLIGNITEAETLFKQVVKLNPYNDAAFYELAQIDLSRGNYGGAEKNVSKALEVYEDNSYYLEFYGGLMAGQYKFKEAAEIYGKLREKEPQRIEYYFQQGYFLSRDEQLKQALEVYDELEERIGLQDDIALERHKIYIKQNKLDEAANELNQLIALHPGEPEYLNMLADFYVVNEQDEKAVKLYEEILTSHPDDAEAITSLADYYKMIGDQEKYLMYSEQAFASFKIPIDAKIAVLFNYIQYFNERKEEAEDAFRLADILIKTHPEDAKAYAIAGDLRNLNDETEMALSFYNKSLELRQDVFTVWQQVFFIHSDNQDYEQLIEKTNEAKEIFPNQPTVYFFNGLAYQQEKDYAKAIKAYERAVKMTVDNDVLKAQVYSNLGDAYNDTEEYEKSDENFEKALAINPNNAYVLNNYSYYLSLRKENLERAAEMSLLSNELEPNNTSFLDTYAWVLFQQGEYEEALEWQGKALNSTQDPSPTLLEHYGDILFKLGRVEDAVSHWQQALEAGSTSDNLSNKIADKKLYE